VESHISVDRTVAHSVTSMRNQEYQTAGRNSPPELRQYSQGRQRKVVGSFWTRYSELCLALQLMEEGEDEGEHRAGEVDQSQEAVSFYTQRYWEYDILVIMRKAIIYAKSEANFVHLRGRSCTYS
jgi:hypothetical protein